MGRKANDGRGRLGGRAKGTPNKPATPVTEWVGNLLTKYRADFEHALSDGQQAPTIYAALTLAAAILRNTEALERYAALREQSNAIAERGTL